MMVTRAILQKAETGQCRRRNDIANRIPIFKIRGQYVIVVPFAKAAIDIAGKSPIIGRSGSRRGWTDPCPEASRDDQT
jgi:hypothetical protein